MALKKAAILSLLVSFGCKKIDSETKTLDTLAGAEAAACKGSYTISDEEDARISDKIKGSPALVQAVKDTLTAVPKPIRDMVFDVGRIELANTSQACRVGDAPIPAPIASCRVESKTAASFTIFIGNDEQTVRTETVKAVMRYLAERIFSNAALSAVAKKPSGETPDQLKAMLAVEFVADVIEAEKKPNAKISTQVIRPMLPHLENNDEFWSSQTSVQRRLSLLDAIRPSQDMRTLASNNDASSVQKFIQDVWTEALDSAVCNTDSKRSLEAGGTFKRAGKIAHRLLSILPGAESLALVNPDKMAEYSANDVKTTFTVSRDNNLATYYPTSQTGSNNQFASAYQTGVGRSSVAPYGYKGGDDSFVASANPTAEANAMAFQNTVNSYNNVKTYGSGVQAYYTKDGGSQWPQTYSGYKNGYTYNQISPGMFESIDPKGNPTGMVAQFKDGSWQYGNNAGSDGGKWFSSPTSYNNNLKNPSKTLGQVGSW